MTQVAADQAKVNGASTTPNESPKKVKGPSRQRLDSDGDVDIDNIPVENDDFFDDEDDPNTVALSKIKSSFMKTLDFSDEEEQEDDVKSKKVDENAVNESAQPSRTLLVEKIRSFQPGSSPEGFRERFLMWNHVGMVIRFENGEGDVDDEMVDASIEVEFHDTTFHHTIHLKTGDFTMADLSMTALLLASAVSALFTKF